MGLIQNSAERARCEFGMQWNNTAYRTSLCSALEHNMASTLPDPSESKFFKSANRLSP